MIERAKVALNAKTDYELAKKLGITHGSVAGYRRRNGVVPLEQCIKIAEITGVSLDWLILGKDERGHFPESDMETTPNSQTEVLDSDKTMLLAGWDFLNAEQRDCVFAVIRRLARGESVVCSKPTINIQASVGQANAGNGNIENLTINR